MLDRADFSIGQLVHHRLFDYRGAVVDVDASFAGTDEWYDQVARSRPPKDEPWYHVLVDGASQQTYVAQRNLEPDSTDRPVHHPAVESAFDGFTGGSYVLRRRAN